MCVASRGKGTLRITTVATVEAECDEDHPLFLTLNFKYCFWVTY